MAGRRNALGSALVTSDTVFAAGSLSKPVLATIALALHEQGEFDLDRPLASILDSDLPAGPGASRITTRHVLQHTSGLPNWRFTSGDAFATAREPGSAWRYSGEGFVLAQRALEKVTGTGLEGLAGAHVFEPLAMSSTSYLWRSDLAQRRAEPFVPEDNRFEDYAVLFGWKERALIEWAEEQGARPGQITLDVAREADTEVMARTVELAGRELPATDPVPNFLTPNAAGSLRTTAPDYLRFLNHWLQSSDLRRRALAEPVPRSGGLRWGLGWGLGPTGASAFWHNGESLGIRALAYADPEVGPDGEALVMLTNGDRGLEVIEPAFVDATGSRSPIFDAI